MKKKLRSFFHNIGKLFLDGARLCFGSLVLGTVLKGEIPHDTLLLIGIIVSSAGAIGGIILVTASEED
jgi:hypothetical protein